MRELAKFEGPYSEVRGNTGFFPLPKALQKRGAVDNRCACPWCSATGREVECPTPVWDTLAMELTTGETWLVHGPEMHGRPRLRPMAAKRAA